MTENVANASDGEEKPGQSAPSASNGAGGKGPDKNRPDRSSVAAYVLVTVFLVVCLATSTILIGLPPHWPQDLQGWLFLLLGSALALFCALAIPQIKGLADNVGSRIGSPQWLKDSYRNGWRVLAAIGVLVLVFALQTYVHPPVMGEELEPGDIYLLSAFSQSPNDPRRILLNEWNESHPLNKVITVDAPGGTDAQHARYENDAKPGGPHQADVYVLDDVWMAQFIQQHWIRPIDESQPRTTDENFLPNVLATCLDSYGHQPGLWGLPFNSDAGLLFYRSDLVPQRTFSTREEYLGASAAAQYAQIKANPALAASTRSLKASYAASLSDSDEMLTVEAFEAIWAAGGQVANPDGQPVYNADGDQVVFDDRALEGVRDLAAAYQSRQITISDGDERADKSDSGGAETQFRGGETLFMRNWPVAYDNLRVPGDKPPVPFDVANLPGPSVLGGQNLAIADSTKKPRAAQALMRFLTSPASELTLFQIGGVPPTRDETYGEASRLSRPYVDEVRNAVVTARPRVITPYYTAFSDQFREGIIRALRNGGQIEPELPAQLAATLKGKGP